VLGREQLRPDHRYILAMRRTAARLDIMEGRAADAIAALESVRAAEDVNLPSPHQTRAETLRLLGLAQLSSGDAAAAERTLRSALDELAMLPSTHWLIGETTSLLGSALRELGSAADGQALLDEGLRIIEGHLGADAAATVRARARAWPASGR
jgi:hypothetical protein